MTSPGHAHDWAPYGERIRAGEWRAVVFRDMVRAELAGRGDRPVLLDIGCGHGFDGDAGLQQSLAGAAGAYLGVEPDPDIVLGSFVTGAHRCLLEDAPIPPGSVDVAFAVMVLEHVASPSAFWGKVREVLRDGGVFWGFTMDARHWFTRASSTLKALGLKDWYLNRLHGRRGEERYENYPVHYRANTPRALRGQTRAFRRVDVLNFGRVGQLDYYFPPRLRGLGRAADRVERTLRLPGSLLAVRAEK